MLAALPGLRELRSVLAGGFLWLVFLWLVIEPRLPNDSLEAGIYDSAKRLGDLAGPVAFGTAATFTAYLVGTLAEELRHGISALYLTARDLPDRVAAGSKRSSQPPRVLSDDSSKADQVSNEPASSPSSPMLAAFKQFVPALKGGFSDMRGGLKQGLGAYFTVLGTTTERVGRAYGALTWPVDELYEFLLASIKALTDTRSNPFSAYVTEEGLATLTSHMRWLTNNNFTPAEDPPDTARIIADFPRTRDRLLSEDLETANEVDRLQAEAEFRLAIVLPLGALSILLAVEASLLWLIALPLLLPFVRSARVRRRQAGDLLIDRIAQRTVVPPSLETWWTEGVGQAYPLRSEDG